MSHLLFYNLRKLVEKNKNFYCKKEVFHGKSFEIYNYRLASFEDFSLYRDALECRGHTFEVTDNGEYIRTVAWPFEKFFNLNENPFTQNINLNSIKNITPKEDGSLIMSFRIDDKLYLKTKGTMESEQAIKATSFLKNNTQYYNEVKRITLSGYTLLFEYCCSKNNPNVLFYPEEKLICIGCRDRKTGKEIRINSAEKYEKDFPEIIKNSIRHIPIQDINNFLMKVPKMKNIEGFVMQLFSGQRIKIKTEEYVKLHRIINSVNTEKQIIEKILKGEIDDIKGLIYGREDIINMINNCENRIKKEREKIKELISCFCFHVSINNDRKTFALEAKKHNIFPLLMQKYSGKELEIDKFILKNINLLIPEVSEE